MSNILVTGGLGFIGSNFIKEIIQSDNFIVNIDSETYASVDKFLLNFEKSKNYIQYKVDISDFKKVDEIICKYSFDYIFHFAAESHVDNSISNPNVFAMTNVIGTLNLLESYKNLEKNNKLFIHVSTDEVFGSIDKGNFTELSLYQPNSPYSASKASSDHFVRSYFNTYDLPVIITNCSNNYGPFQHKEKFIPTVIRSLLKRVNIPVYGDGKNTREWISVKDHVSALMYLSERGSVGESYCIGSGYEFSNINLAEKICDIFDKLTQNTRSKELISFVEDRKGHDFRYSVDSQKIKDLGWKNQHDFDSALKDTVQWYIDNKDFLQ